jgi:SAM-dependent methyltransferase
MVQAQRLVIASDHSGLYIDSLSVEPSMLVVIEGWTTDLSKHVDDLVAVTLDSCDLALIGSFRVMREDVAAAIGSDEMFHGVVWHFAMPITTSGAARLEVALEGRSIFEVDVLCGGSTIPYERLVDSPGVHHRGGIYASGPPDTQFSPEAFAVARSLPTPILDFGCGTGALVRALRQCGLEASGLEVDRLEIAEGLFEEVRDHVRLTDGTFPLPLKDRSFASVVATEVLEHIEGLTVAVEEIMRIADSEIFVTVPDASAIPALFPHAVVPWHLLEGSHLNFFSAVALESLFRPAFEVVARYRFGRVVVNGTVTFTSLALRLRRVQP